MMPLSPPTEKSPFKRYIPFTYAPRNRCPSKSVKGPLTDQRNSPISPPDDEVRDEYEGEAGALVATGSAALVFDFFFACSAENAEPEERSAATARAAMELRKYVRGDGIDFIMAFLSPGNYWVH